MWALSSWRKLPDWYDLSPLMFWNILWSLSNRSPGITWVLELHKMRKTRHILGSPIFISKQGMSSVNWIRYVSWIQKLILLSSENHRAGSFIIDCCSVGIGNIISGSWGLISLILRGDNLEICWGNVCDLVQFLIILSFQAVGKVKAFNYHTCY